MLSAKCKMLAMPSRNALMTTTDGQFVNSIQNISKIAKIQLKLR